MPISFFNFYTKLIHFEGNCQNLMWGLLFTYYFPYFSLRRALFFLAGSNPAFSLTSQLASHTQLGPSGRIQPAHHIFGYPHPFWGYIMYFVYNSMYFVYNFIYFCIWSYYLLIICQPGLCNSLVNPWPDPECGCPWRGPGRHFFQIWLAGWRLVGPSHIWLPPSILGVYYVFCI